MVRTRVILIIVLMLLLQTQQTVYADTTADIYKLYKIEAKPALDTELNVLNEILEEYSTVASKVASAEMMDTAVSIYKEQYYSIIKAVDKNLFKLQDDITKAEELINATASSDIDTIKSADAYYRTAVLAYDNAISERELLLSQISNIAYKDPVSEKDKAEYITVNAKLAAQKQIVAKAKAYAEIGKVGKNKFPLSSKTSITSSFGWRVDPMNHNIMQFHKGADMRAAMDTPVLAQFGGVVEGVKTTETGGKTVVINHGDGIRTVYIHLNSFNVKVGQHVNQYQIIAYSGNTGSRTTGPHLHFGIYINNEAVDPRLLYGS